MKQSNQNAIYNIFKHNLNFVYSIFFLQKSEVFLILNGKHFNVILDGYVWELYET